MTRLKYLLPTHILSTIYHSLFLPHISYGLTAWGNSVSKEYKRLITLQKKVVRTICQAKYNSHTDPLFKKMNMLKIRDLFNLNCCKLFYKSCEGTLKPYFTNILQPNSLVHSYNTRHANDAHQLNISMHIERQLLNYKVSTSWNELSQNMKNRNYYKRRSS